MVNFELFWLLNGLLNWLLSGFCAVLRGFAWVCVGLKEFECAWPVCGGSWVCLGVFGCFLG